MKELLRTRLQELDAARFIGRERELELLQSLLAQESAARVALVHGPAGVGKSALLRELARRAQRAGWSVLQIDARTLTPLPAALQEALEPAAQVRRPLLLLDSWERLDALQQALREQLLPGLPAECVVVIAGRRRPAPEWQQAGWEQLALQLPLQRLDELDSDRLLVAHGLKDQPLRRQAIAWGRGSPLALALAARRGAVPAQAGSDCGSFPPSDQLLEHLLPQQPGEEIRPVLAVAALAQVVSAELIEAALPDADAAAEYRWLAEHPGIEAVGRGLMLHDLLGELLREDLKRRAPEMERRLRRRLVDHLYERALHSGFVHFTRDIQHLVRNPAIRWGFAWDASGRLRLDGLRAGDMQAIARQSSPQARRWLEDAARYFEQSPERVAVVRDQSDRIAGYTIAMTLANAPDFALSDPICGPRLRHARDSAHSEGALVYRQAIDLWHEGSSQVIALLGMAGIINSGLHNPACAYLPIAAHDAPGQRFSSACGAVAIPELQAEHLGLRIECHLLDYGPGGLLASQRATVYRELGLPEPQPRTDMAPAALALASAQAVRSALRNYASMPLLAEQAIAPAHGSVRERAEGARAILDSAIECAFGNAERDRRLRAVLELGYLNPAPTHELAAAQLHMSRTTYFRQLRTAVERVADCVMADLER